MTFKSKVTGVDADFGFLNPEEATLKTTVFPLELLLTVDAPPNVNVMDLSLIAHEWDPLMVTPFEVAVDTVHVLPTDNAES